MEAIEVLVVDDNFVVRSGLVNVLGAAEGLAVVGEASDGDSAIARVQELMPDVVLMDVRMPGMDGIEATRRIASTVPHVRILVVTLSEEPAHLLQAILAGAQGYLVHGRFSAQELAEAVRIVHAGGALITPAIVPELVELTRHPSGSGSTGTMPGSPLTEREYAVLDLVRTGHSNRQIARHLGIREKTVKNHIHNIYAKLHVHSRLQIQLQRTLDDSPGDAH